ncbi:MAG: DNA primase [Spirochaetia bacterium]|nr:DNA primase [Spirochaetia bacterium]
MKISDEVLSQIKERLSLSQVVGRYVTLHSAGGSDFKACCPFHHEKTPSFYVHDDKGYYHCFGCGKSGTIFNFVMEMDHLTFPEAVAKLASQAGIQLREESENDKKNRNQRQSLYELNHRLSATFHYLLLKSDQATFARQYLKDRGVSDEMIENFNLGYAPAGGRWLYTFLRKKGYDDVLLQASGLFSKNYFPYSIFQDRLMFPIRTWDNKTIAFSGRQLNGESKAKYINSPETAIFSKKHNLFGIHEALQTLRDKKEALLCEGNFDVMALHQAGVTQAMAPLGTAFTQEQGKLLSRYCSKVSLLFDNDAAGASATKKAVVLLQQLGLECQVIDMQGGKDPSEVLNSHGAEALHAGVSSSLSGFDYLVQVNRKEHDIRKPKGKGDFFAAMCPYLDATDNEIEKDTFLRSIAEILQVDRNTINQQYLSAQQQFRRQDFQQQAAEPAVHPLSLDRLSVDLYLMLTVANNRSLFVELRQHLDAEELKDDEARQVYTLLEDLGREQEGKNDEYLLQACHDPQLLSDLKSSFILSDFHRENSHRIMNELIDRILLRNMEEQRNTIVHLISLSSEDGRLEGQEELLQEKMELDKQIMLLKAKPINSIDTFRN